MTVFQMVFIYIVYRITTTDIKEQKMEYLIVKYEL